MEKNQVNRHKLWVIIIDRAIEGARVLLLGEIFFFFVLQKP